jgi:hypothetical protein
VNSVLALIRPTLLLISLACYEGGPRTGPLASLADSVAPEKSGLECNSRSEKEWPDTPRFHSCRVKADTATVLYIGATGRILAILTDWHGDSSGSLRAANARAALAAALGPPDYSGGDGHGNQDDNWRSDTLCVSLHWVPSREWYQLSHYLPELFGHCV